MSPIEPKRQAGEVWKHTSGGQAKKNSHMLGVHVDSALWADKGEREFEVILVGRMKSWLRGFAPCEITYVLPHLFNQKSGPG